jgi:hypothetical protein
LRLKQYVRRQTYFGKLVQNGVAVCDTTNDHESTSVVGKGRDALGRILEKRTVSGERDELLWSRRP